MGSKFLGQIWRELVISGRVCSCVVGQGSFRVKSVESGA